MRDSSIPCIVAIVINVASEPREACALCVEYTLSVLMLSANVPTHLRRTDITQYCNTFAKYTAQMCVIIW